MIFFRRTADARDQYRQSAAADVARVATAAQTGNLAEAFKNNTTLLPYTIIENPTAITDNSAADKLKRE
jgi:hypothetical protein